MVNVPSRVRRVADGERLGDARSRHAPLMADRRSRAWLVVLGLPGLILLPFTVVFLARGFGWASGLGLVLTVIYLGAAAHVLVRHVLPGDLRVVYRYENGLVLASWRAVTAYPWDAITDVRVSGVRRAPGDVVTWRIGLVAGGAPDTEIRGDRAGARELVETVSREVTDRALPKYLSRVDAGGRVRLGPFTISRDGITKDGESLFWDDVAAVEIRGGMVYVDRADRLSGMTATAGEVPNAVAFGELARHIREARHRPDAGEPGEAPMVGRSEASEAGERRESPDAGEPGEAPEAGEPVASEADRAAES